MKTNYESQELKECITEMITDNIDITEWDDELTEDNLLIIINQHSLTKDLVRYVHGLFMEEPCIRGEIPPIRKGDVFYQRRMDFHLIVNGFCGVADDIVDVTFIQFAGTQDQKTHRWHKSLEQFQSYLSLFNYINLNTVKLDLDFRKN